MRIAIFFTPPPDHPLTGAASAWLTRDAFPANHPTVELRDAVLSPDEIRELVVEPRRYGFHATLKAPFRLAAGFELINVTNAVAAFARNAPVEIIPSLRIERLGSFFALTPRQPAPRLNALAAEVVKTLDRFRAPLTLAEIARRRTAQLTPSQSQKSRSLGLPLYHGRFSLPHDPDRAGAR